MGTCNRRCYCCIIHFEKVGYLPEKETSRGTDTCDASFMLCMIKATVVAELLHYLYLYKIIYTREYN